MSNGAKVVRGGQKSKAGASFYEPTLIRDVTSNMQCSREEIFGPVAGIAKYGKSISCLSKDMT